MAAICGENYAQQVLHENRSVWSKEIPRLMYLFFLNFVTECYVLIRQLYSDSVAYKAHTFCFCSQTANLALRKPTAQSSTYSNEGRSEHAVDGVRNTNWGAIGLCTHTNMNNPAWWRVDLGSNHVPLSDVFIINQLITNLDRSRGYKITLGKYAKQSGLKLITAVVKSLSRGNPIIYQE